MLSERGLRCNLYSKINSTIPVANIREQSIGSEGVHVIASDGSEFHATVEECRAMLQPPGQSFTASERRAIGAAWISDALGADMVPAESITLDSDDDGTPTGLEVR